MPSSVIEALQRRDSSALERLLAADATFHSPVSSYPGRALATRVLSAVAVVLDGLTIDEQLETPDGIVSFVSASADGHELEGMLRERRVDGRVREVTLMARPLAALEVAIGRMRELLDA